MINIFSDKNKKSSVKRILESHQKISPKKKDVSTSPLSFQENFNLQLEASNWNQNIDQCLESLDQLQNDLINKPTIQLIEQYRSTIGQLLKKLLNNYQSTSFYKGMRNKIELKTWQSIDSHLDDLSNQVIKNHVEGFKILSKINLIKGLMLDLKVGKN